MRTWLFASLCVLMSGVATAHQLKAAMTTVLINERTGNLELMHRFYLHDTEHAVETLFGGHADIFKNQKDQQKFAEYVSERVSMKVNQGKPIKLKLVGAEIDGKFFWVYQETQTPTKLLSIQMQQGALRDVWPEQINMVNFEGKGRVRSLHFDGEDNWLSVTF